MRPGAFTSSLALLALLGLAGASTARAQVLDPIQYDLYPGSEFEFGCSGPCECPIFISGPMKGSFTFYRTSVDPLFTHYALLNIMWEYPMADSGTSRIVRVTGKGTYDIGGEVALTQRMTLDVSFNGGPSQFFDSGLVPTRAPFPAIDIAAHSNPTGCFDSTLHVVAAPPGFASVEPFVDRRLLWSALPNPTSGSVEMLFTPQAAEHARVDVIDVRGRIVATLMNGPVSGGEYRLRWNGRDTRGTDAGPGIFWIRAEADARTAQQRIVRLR